MQAAENMTTFLVKNSKIFGQVKASNMQLTVNFKFGCALSSPPPSPHPSLNSLRKRRFALSLFAKRYCFGEVELQVRLRS